MAADLISAMQDAGGTLAQTLASGNAVGSRTRYGTVKKNNGTTLDVELCGATLAAVPMLTTCVGAAAGDRCILTIDGALVTVTGIIANAGNAPYVKLAVSNLASGWTVDAWRCGNLVTVRATAISPWSNTERWGASICSLPSDAAPRSQCLATGQMADKYWDNMRPFSIWVDASACVACNYKGFAPYTMQALFTYLCG